MPLLAALLVSLASSIATFLVAFVSKKVAFGLAAVAIYVGLTAALFVMMRGSIAALSSSTSLVGVLGMFFSAAIPPIAPVCISTIITVWTGCAVYKWQAKALDVFLKA